MPLSRVGPCPNLQTLDEPVKAFKAQATDTYRRARLSKVDLLVETACFVKKEKYTFSVLKASDLN